MTTDHAARGPILRADGATAWSPPWRATSARLDGRGQTQGSAG